MTWLVLAVVALPFLAAGLVLALGHRRAALTKAGAVGLSAAGWLGSVALAVPRLGDAEPVARVFSSTSLGPPIELAVYVDQLGAVVLLLATTVALLVQSYSLSYLHDDPRYPSYAALVSVFTGAMSMVVVADDLWVLLIGWELMGACSYFLIAHHWERHEARAGAVKAFLMTRTADLGLLFAIILLGARYDSYRVSTILAAVADGATGGLVLPALLLVLAVVGKSAQVPLHTWLPDAMPGPTPISALIHAATMVAAGVYLVARLMPLFEAAPAALNVLAVVASVTMLVAAAHAVVADDLKRVLAWSTVSQLAYMFGALAVGAWSAAVLHLLAHGAFKALLFLGAGSVAHAVGSTSLSQMGGLRSRVPVTFVTMTLGFAALAGVVPTVGFFTKDAVLGAALDASGGEQLWGPLALLVFASGLVTALLTMAYAARAWLLVFFGTPAWVDASGRSGTGTDPAGARSGAVAGTGKESPASMTGPLLLLALPTVLGGVVVFSPQWVFGSSTEQHLVHLDLALVTTLLLVAVLVAVLFAWRKGSRAFARPSTAEAVEAEQRRWTGRRVASLSLDRVYAAAVVGPVGRLAQVVRTGDRDVIDASADGAGASARGLGRVLRRTQSGDVQVYLMVVVVGAAALAVAAGVIA